MKDDLSNGTIEKAVVHIASQALGLHDFSPL